jgi:hypothetical protein
MLGNCCMMSTNARTNKRRIAEEVHGLRQTWVSHGDVQKSSRLSLVAMTS